MSDLLDKMLEDAGMVDNYRGGIDRLGLLHPPDDGPAILLYDIETAPALCWMWTAYNANVVAIEQDWYLLCFAYRWLGNGGTGFVAITDNPTFTPDSSDDQNVAEALAVLFDRADITVAHNGDRFDTRKANAAFSRNQLIPPSPYQTIDTLKESRRYFGHYKHNLDDLGRVYELGEKTRHTGFDLWRKCMAGDPDSWATMEDYNRQDVELLERLYLEIRPWIGTPGKKAHPNLGHWFKGERVCTNCGSDRLIPASTPHRGSVSEWEAWRCLDCGHNSRARVRKTQRGTGGVKTV